MLEIKDKSLVRADCLDVLVDWYNGGRNNFIDVVYIDPPFNSKRDYNIIISGSELTEEAFKDTWSRIGYLDQLEIISKLSPTFYMFLVALDKSAIPKSYITYLCAMGIRCWYMREALKDTGSFFYHCDDSASHYIKMMLDVIFGIENFRNEIIWCYSSATSPGVTKFPRKHDTIFWYAKSKTYTWNPDAVRIPYNEFTRSIEGQKGAWGTSPEKEDVFSLHPLGKIPEDWWIDIGQTFRSSIDNCHYPTQKPRRLLERIVLASSNIGDLIADFYLGGGTTTFVSAKLDRRYIGVDINLRALQIAQQRLESLGLQVKRDFFMYGIGSSKDIREMIDLNVLGEDKDSRFDLEDLLFKYCFKNPKVVGNKKKRGDNSIDGRFMFDFGGEKLLGIAQATVSGNKTHLRQSASHFFSEQEKASMLVYATWKDKITDKLIEEAKSYGKIGGIDKVTLMTLEEVIDDGKQITLPSDPQNRVEVQPVQTF
jgi:site-specific DNA-methyltransferase (adenine-specific)